jgi:hypothetical protein
MVTRWRKAPVAFGPAITFGHLVLFIGCCGVLYNVSITYNNGSSREKKRSGTSREKKRSGTSREKDRSAIEETADAGGARGLERTGRTFQLTVPFYVYEDRDLNWEDATLNGKPYEPAAPSAGGCGTFSGVFRVDVR